MSLLNFIYYLTVRVIDKAVNIFLLLLILYVVRLIFKIVIWIL